MNGAIAWFANNKVAANLLMMLILVSGFMAMSTIRKEVLPEFSSQMISITVPYPGASPPKLKKILPTKLKALFMVWKA